MGILPELIIEGMATLLTQFPALKTQARWRMPKYGAPRLISNDLDIVAQRARLWLVEGGVPR